MNSNDNVMRVVRPLVDRVGLRALLLAIAAIAHERAIDHVADEPQLAVNNWQAVATDLEKFARESLRGLR